MILLKWLRINSIRLKKANLSQGGGAKPRVHIYRDCRAAGQKLSDNYCIAHSTIRQPRGCFYFELLSMQQTI